MTSFSCPVVVSAAALLVLGGCGSGGQPADRIGSSGDATSEVSAGRDEVSTIPESTSTTEGDGYVPEPVVGSYHELKKRLLGEPLFDTRPDPRVVVLRVPRGALTSSFEAEFRSAVPDLPADARVFVFECSFTRVELDEFLAFQRGGEWKDEGSKAVRTQWPRLLAELGRDGVADCLVLDPIDCLSETEIEAVSAAATRLNISNVDLQTGERTSVGESEPDSRIPPGVWASANPECTYRTNE